MPHSIHSALHAPWQAVIERLETRMLVGIQPSETTPQRVWVEAVISGHYAAYPKDISECIDYGLLHQLVTEEWPKRPQTGLLETLVMELFAVIFQHAPHAARAEIGVYKPDIFPAAARVGVRLSLNRAEFLALRHAAS